MRHWTQAHRAAIAADPEARTYRKRSRIIAVRQTEDFSVDTDRGMMFGVAGDWLVTNHPDDDPGSDVWSISAVRMRNTYDEAPEATAPATDGTPSETGGSTPPGPPPPESELERVANAIYVAMVNPDLTWWDDLDPELREAYLRGARAAIRVLA